MNFVYGNQIEKIKEEIHEFNIQSEYGNSFHSYEMYRFYQELKNEKPFFIGLCNDKKVLKALIMAVLYEDTSLIKKTFSSRVIVYSGPVIDSSDANSSKNLDLILKELDRILPKHVIYTEIRNFKDYSPFLDTYQDNGYKYVPHYDIHVDCSKADYFSNFSKIRQRNIKKSLKNGAQIVEPESLDEVRIFYDILKSLYKKKVKKPLPAFDYFETFYHKKAGKYFLISYNSKIVGGIMCPILNGKIIYEAYIAGLDGNYQNISPSVLATYAAIKYANENAIKWFDLMGAGKPGVDYGVRDFKMTFGGKLLEPGRFIKIHKPGLYKLGTLAMNLYGKIK